MERCGAEAKSSVAKGDFLRMGASWRILASMARDLVTAEGQMARGYRPNLAELQEQDAPSRAEPASFANIAPIPPRSHTPGERESHGHTVDAAGGDGGRGAVVRGRRSGGGER
jgi:hypothetical protein